MSDEPDGLERRLRQLHAGLDARPGFEQRVMARVAALRAAQGAPRADLRAQFERRRERARRALRREAWLQGATLAGIGIAAAAVAWEFAPALVAHAAAASGGLQPASLAGVTLLGLAAAVGWLLRRNGIRII